MLRRSTTLVLVLCLLLALPAVASAGPKTKVKKPKKPYQVRSLVIDAATTTGLRLRWPKAKRAKKYVVEMATNIDMVGARKVRVFKKHGARWVTGLKPGQRYCFQVRPKSKRQVVRVIKKRTKKGKVRKKKVRRAVWGKRSQRVCKAPIIAEGRGGGPTYNVVTYNLCVQACARNRGQKKGVPWSTRLPGARLLATGLAPDVLGLQETNSVGGLPRQFGMTEAFHARGGKLLLYNPRRFDVARDVQGAPRAGEFSTGPDSASGGKDRYAAWAELVDRASGRSVFFVDAHLAPTGASETQSDRDRTANIRLLSAGIAAYNTNKRPVVVMGDFNSHTGRSYDSPTREMNRLGFHDSYELARSLVLPHHNSGNQFQAVPLVGVSQGFHMDKVWVDPRTTRVLEWRNGARIQGGRYAPLPSDHSPVRARIQLDPLPAM